MEIEYKRAQDLQISVVDNEIIRGYMKRINQGESVDPVRVLGARVKDGNHRAAAYKLLGLDVPTVPFLTRTAEQLFGKDHPVTLAIGAKTKRTVYKILE